MTPEDSLINTLNRWSILIKKIIKIINKNRIPKSHAEIKAMKDRLEREEQERLEINKMTERIKHLQKKKKDIEYLKKIERRRKIRKFLHLPYKTYNEDNLFRDEDPTRITNDGEESI